MALLVVQGPASLVPEVLEMHLYAPVGMVEAEGDPVGWSFLYFED
jgi:hypothetical protein